MGQKSCAVDCGRRQRFDNELSRLRVLQLGDVAGVAQRLALALAEAGVDSGFRDFPRIGARWPRWLKPLAYPIRGFVAENVAYEIWMADWRPDVVHVHWLPNALIGPELNKREIPWVLHVHGSDVRHMERWRQRLLDRAPAVFYATPDLAGIRSDAVYLPVPIREVTVAAEPKWDVLLSARASREKGPAVAFEAARMLKARYPELRIAAVDGPAFEQGPERLPWMEPDAFLRTLASARVVVGQFAIGALGVTDLQAMMLGRPLVTWVRPDLYDDAPPVHVARTPAEITQAVLDALEWPQDGREWVRRHHDPQMIAERAIGVYREVLARQPADTEVEVGRAGDRPA